MIINEVYYERLGKIVFLYDYTVQGISLPQELERNFGVISNFYKWCDPYRMIMHVANGLECFLRHKEIFAHECNFNSRLNKMYSEEIRRAFDIIFPFKEIDTSRDGVQGEIERYKAGDIS